MAIKNVKVSVLVIRSRLGFTTQFSFSFNGILRATANMTDSRCQNNRSRELAIEPDMTVSSSSMVRLLFSADNTKWKHKNKITKCNAPLFLLQPNPPSLPLRPFENKSRPVTVSKHSSSNFDLFIFVGVWFHLIFSVKWKITLVAS